MLPDAEWRRRPGLGHLLRTIGADTGEARFVGGAVRDSLLGQAVKDIDVATVHEPETVLARLKAEGIKAVPTGIAHGTITAVLEDGPVEITTLRRDVATDGRRATIAYTGDWHEDAARRDFTINALYADPRTGEIFDYFGGAADVEARCVRFIGRAEDRIAEDHLRILRYFRFLSRFGGGEPDAEAYAACMAQANSLMALSRERIADELLKLLATMDPAPVLQLMVEGGILAPVIPEIGDAGVEHMAALVQREEATGSEGSPLRRLCALLPADPVVGDAVAARLKLSNKARKRIATALSPAPPYRSFEELAYRIGVEGALDHLLLDENMPADAATSARLRNWQKPALPIGGAALLARGLTPGPDIAQALREIEEQWIAEGFAAERVEAIADQIVSKFQRARQ